MKLVDTILSAIISGGRLGDFHRPQQQPAYL